MKPNFILDLSQDGIRLRAADGDDAGVVGEVKLSEPEFDAKVLALRNAVAEKSDTPLATELRIPNSEILFTTLDDPEFDAKTAKGTRDELRDAAVRDALEGMTPYALNDLNFIWKVKGKGELSIAAVAHETLAEAEQFAASKGFNPVRFVAHPGADKFKGIADFGPTQTQRARAAAEARVAAEAAAKAEAEAKAAAEAAKAAAEAAPPPQPEPPVAKAEEPAKPDQAALPAAESPVAAAPEAKAPEAATEPKAVPAPAAKPDPKPAEGAATPSGGAGRRLTISAVVALPETNAAPAAPPSATNSDAIIRPEADAPRVGFSQPRVNDPLPPLDDSTVVDDVPPMPPVSFASRRKPGDAPTMAPAARPKGPLSPGAAADESEKDSRLSRIAARFAVAPGADSLAKASVPPPPPRRSAPGTPVGTGAAKTVLRGSAGTPGRPGPIPVAASPVQPDSAVAASLTPPADIGTRSLDFPVRSRQSEAEAMTVFGARAEPVRRSYTPLIIGIALIAAVAVAVWAAFLLIGDQQVSGETGALLPESEAAIVAPPPLEPAPDAATLTPEPEAQPIPEPAPVPAEPAETELALLPAEQPSAVDTAGAALPGATDPSEPAPGHLSAPDSTVASLGPVAPPAPSPEALPISEAPPPPLANDLLQRPPAGDANSDNVVGRYATTGVWVQTPGAPVLPETDRVDDLYIAAVDPSILQPAAPGAAALPTLSAPDQVLPQVPPAGPDQTFDLDERGLVRATPEGAVSPTGVLVTAGTPPIRPPTTPNRPENLTPTPETQPDLPRIRPRDRPSDVAEDSDQSQLSLPDDSQFAALQPRPRPEALVPTAFDAPATLSDDETAQDRASTAALSVAGASTATPQAPLSVRAPRPAPANLAALRPTPEPAPEPEPEIEVAAAPAEPVSPFAVARSRLPRERPGNIDKLVAQAIARAPEVRDDDEPQVTRVAAPAAVTTPTIPSRASVAKQATVKNAINLGRINLIGVYGSTSNRSALVRLSNGEFVKVKVGDRVDGGRVAAIGQSELSYTKSGRQVVLAMPKG